MADKTLGQRLGFSNSERVVVLHADDIGMCQATVTGFEAVVSRSVISAASAMVPCPWFPAVATWCREHAAIADMGVHLTLNSEWADYRWPPVLGPAVPSLRDDVGYFARYPPAIHERADKREVYLELRAQVDRALACGIDVTHIDSHIFALRHPALIDVYVALSREYRLPGGIVRRPDSELEGMKLPTAQLDDYYRQVGEAEADGLAVFDAWDYLSLGGAAERRLDIGKRALERLPAGVSVLLSHPAVDTPELRAAVEDWPARVADLELLLSEEWARAVEASGIQVIGMRQIRDAVFA
jgi:predicted glycoside hydrolase/deacetylase ChbG (UPF0249 family)